MMMANMSSEVQSTQASIHPRLLSVVETHRVQAWRQPLHGPSALAFEALRGLLRPASRKIVLDSGCGTGESTRLIARAMPDCLVLGVDKSLSRLSRTGADSFPHREGNTIWLRADLTTFWRLALEDGWRLHRHYLLYPNPWPKPGQLLRRWHAHPVFPALLKLGGRLEMRCNWEIYAQEFATAANCLLGTGAKPHALAESTVSSPFERKYLNSGHRLYSVVVSCDSSGVK